MEALTTAIKQRGHKQFLLWWILPLVIIGG